MQIIWHMVSYFLTCYNVTTNCCFVSLVHEWLNELLNHYYEICASRSRIFLILMCIILKIIKMLVLGVII
jgi:hypothetical protein